MTSTYSMAPHSTYSYSYRLVELRNENKYKSQEKETHVRRLRMASS